MGAELSTVTVSAAEVAEFRAASVALAVRMWGPSETWVVSQEMAYGLEPKEPPRFPPSRWYCTPVTLMLSLALALAAKATLPDTKAPLTGAVMLMLGGVTSGNLITRWPRPL